MAKAKRSKTKVASTQPNRYTAIISEVFNRYYSKDSTEFAFKKSDFAEIARDLGIEPVKNFADVTYSFRYRLEFPDFIRNTARDGFEWVILGAGKGRYRMTQVRFNRILPDPNRIIIKIPEAVPQLVVDNKLDDEQGLLARVRYNRLIDTFLGVTAYSLQNHLRSSVKGLGQVEIDELYVAVDKSGNQYAIPVQAKGGTDKLAMVQTMQDIEWCGQKLPHLICRPVSVQFLPDGTIVMFELVIQDNVLRKKDERHYVLVDEKISTTDRELYATIPVST